MSLIYFTLLCFLIFKDTAAEFDPTQHENWKLLQNEYCDNNPTSRIIGGTEAQLGEIPWIAGFVFKDRENGEKAKYFCSGSIISKRIILTAAHCFAGRENFFLSRVVLGQVDKKCESDTCADMVQKIEPLQVISHNQSVTLWYDIALIRLNKDIEFNSFVRPICVPRGELLRNTFAGYVATAAGWGIKDKAKQLRSAKLRKLNLRVKDNVDCNIPEKIFDETKLCAVAEEVGADPCKGDSGGPLSIQEGERNYLIAITAFGGICGKLGIPHVFTRVSAYMQWILDNLVENKINYKVVNL